MRIDAPASGRNRKQIYLHEDACIQMLLCVGACMLCICQQSYMRADQADAPAWMHQHEADEFRLGGSSDSCMKNLGEDVRLLSPDPWV